MIVIEPAETERQFQAVRDLFRAFVVWHRETHLDDHELIDRYFDAEAFESELDGLPGIYAPPAGRLLVTFVDGAPAGCVGLRDLGDSVCEMKRMFVRPAFQRRGIGRRLAERVLAEAREVGYRRMRLDTSWRQTDAISLYTSLGFRQVEPPDSLPAELSVWLRFFERDL